MAFITGNCRWITVAIILVSFFGLAIAATIVLSLITLYIPNQAKPVCQISFRSMTALATDAGPIAIKSGDLNKDGYVDLVVVNTDGDSISVFLGNGDGTFKSRRNLSNNDEEDILMVAIADVNNDKNLDIVGTNSGTSSIGVFLGKGDGTFSDQIVSSTGTGSSPFGVAVGDFDKDGNADLAVSDNGNSRLLIMKGYGNGTFTTSNTYTTGNFTSPNIVVVNDFNKDNNLDVVVGCGQADFIAIFLGDGKGSFNGQTNYYIASGPFAVATVDMNNDGHLDIVTANSFSDTVSVLLGSSTGTFNQANSFSIGADSAPTAIAVGDFNRDRNQDVIVVNIGESTFGILRGSGNKQLQTVQNFSTGTESMPTDLAVADFNRDNRLDVAVVNYNDNTIELFIGTCSS